MVQTAVSYKFTVDEFERMAEAGIFREDARVELIDGEVLCMSAVGNRHLWAVTKLTTAFASLAASSRAYLSFQNPVALDELSEPQPDLTLLRYSANPDTSRAPRPGEILLIVEVADSSLAHDRETKVPLYARAGIPEVWLVDLTTDCIEVFRQPSAGAYAEHTSATRTDSVTPAAFPDLRIEVGQIIA